LGIDEKTRFRHWVRRHEMKIYLFFDKKNGIVIRYTGRLGSWVNRQIVGFPEILKKNAEFIGVIT